MNYQFLDKRMKTAFSLLALIVTAGLAHAGGFGGPPPFTNGSPLLSGVDGSYQASARGTNITGVFRFTYIDGRQTADSITLDNGTLTVPYNDYVFFVEGLVFRGLVQANINDTSLVGVLDEGGVNAPNGSGGAGGPPLSITALMTGEFSAFIQTNSSDYFFRGKGILQLTNTTDTTIVVGGKQAFRFTGIRNSQSTSS